MSLRLLSAICVGEHENLLSSIKQGAYPVRLELESDEGVAVR